MNKKATKLILSAVVLFSVFGSSAFVAQTVTVNNVATTEQTNVNIETISTESSAGETAQTSAPDAVVKDLYKTHNKDEGVILDGKSRKLLDKYFDKTLADFIWKDLTTHTDEVGVLDFDPFYNAQDTRIKNFAVGKPKINGNKGAVIVTFQNFTRKETLNYQLVRQNSAWKISDIKYTDGTSLLGYFKEAAKIAQNDNEEHFFEGTYKVGDTTCTVKPIKMAFEVKWAKGTGTMIFIFDGDESNGRYSY